jgi:hypothetical protein
VRELHSNWATRTTKANSVDANRLSQSVVAWFLFSPPSDVSEPGAPARMPGRFPP